MKKTYLLALIAFVFGSVMFLSTSYSLIIGKLVTDESYSFDVADFNVQFSDNKTITLSGIPESDADGLKNSKEFSFTVSNNSDYDVNYRIDIIEDSSTKVSEVIHYAYTLNGSLYSEVLPLNEFSTIKQNKVLRANKKDVYKIKMWLSLDADESYMNKSFSATISLNATQNEYKYATSVIEKLATNKQDSVVRSNQDYRYSSVDAPNYLWFNCKDDFTKGEDYCEKWRIVGSFVNKGEKAKDEYYMLKILNTNKVESLPFNNSELNGDYDKSYIETFANSMTRSKTGRIVYKFADLFIVQWKSMLDLYPKAKYGGWIF